MKSIKKVNVNVTSVALLHSKTMDIIFWIVRLSEFLSLDYSHKVPEINNVASINPLEKQ